MQRQNQFHSGFMSNETLPLQRRSAEGENGPLHVFPVRYFIRTKLNSSQHKSYKTITKQFLHILFPHQKRYSREHIDPAEWMNSEAPIIWAPTLY